MALPVVNYPILTPDQANPFFRGLKQGQDLYSQFTQNQFLHPALEQEMQRAKIANSLKQNELNYAPQMSLADLLYRQAQTPNLQAQTSEAQARVPLINAQTRDIPSQIQARDLGNQLKKIQLDYIKNGGQLGGKFGSRFTGGSNYVDPFTGEIKSMPTTASANYLQRAIQSSGQLQPVLKDIAEGQAPYLGAGGNILKGVDFLRNYLSGGSTESQERQTNYLSSDADLNTATEMMVKAFGLNATNENFKHMRNVIEPRTGETAQGYQKRIEGEVNKLAKRQGQYQNVLQSGYNTGQYQIPQALPQTPVQQQKLQRQFEGQPLTIGNTLNIPQGSRATKVYNPKTGRIE